MGFNTVAFILNDFSAELEQSPKSVAYLLARPPMSDEGWQRNHQIRESLAKDHNEPVLHSQSLEILPTFHAEDQRFFSAGGNRIDQLTPIKLGVSKEGKKTVTLELPDWYEPRWDLTRPKNWPKLK